MPATSSLALLAVVAGVLVAAVVDLRTRRIPNALTTAITALGIGLAAAGLSSVSPGASIAGFALGLALMMPGHLLGATGGGDVKLMAAIGANVGPAAVFDTFLLTAIAGGVLAIAIAARRRRLGSTLAGAGRLFARAPVAREEIRSAPPASRFAYGPAIAAGTVLAALLA